MTNLDLDAISDTARTASPIKSIAELDVTGELLQLEYSLKQCLLTHAYSTNGQLTFSLHLIERRHLNFVQTILEYLPGHAQQTELVEGLIIVFENVEND